MSRIATALFFAQVLLGDAVSASDAVPSQALPATFEAVREADMEFAEIGWRLAAANVAICDQKEPGTGIQLHTLDQFDPGAREAAEAHFAFATPVSIEGIVAGSPAERAGLRRDDSLVRVGPVKIADILGKPGTTDRLVAAQLALAALPVDRPIPVEALRGGKPVQVTVQPVPICRSRFELRLASDFRASADGTMVQVSSAFLETYPEQQLAAVAAHEFSHNILRHRVRLEARGVTFGMLSGFGASVKYFRQTEIQADLLSVYLLTNAGYDPHASLAFWKSFGPSKAGGIFRTRSHPHWRDRVKTISAEIDKIGGRPERPIVPALIAQRDQQLDGDWQSLLIRN